MTCINVTEFVLISYLEKDHSMIERRCLKSCFQTIIHLMFDIKQTFNRVFSINLSDLNMYIFFRYLFKAFSD